MSSADGKRELGAKIRAYRERRDLKLGEVGEALRATGLRRGTSPQNLSQIELGNSWPSLGLVEKLDEVLGTGGDLRNALRHAKVPTAILPPADRARITAHLFFPLYVDTVPVGETTADSSLDWLPEATSIGSSCDGSSTLHCFPFGVMVLHERHTFEVDSLADVAMWRHQQIARSPDAVLHYLAAGDHHARSRDHAPYCFTAFVLHAGPWETGDVKRRAAHLLSMPRIFSSDPDPAALATKLLQSDTELQDVVDHSLLGSHYGGASWAAVTMLPVSEAASLESALVRFEIQLQAFWCYMSNVADQTTFSDEEYAAPFVRRMLARLQRPWPTETTAVRRLREAVFVTSRIETLVQSALSCASPEAVR